MMMILNSITIGVNLIDSYYKNVFHFEMLRNPTFFVNQNISCHLKNVYLLSPVNLNSGNMTVNKIS